VVRRYGERLYPKEGGGGGYSFMDSPGNDLESIAGQVAAGCNMITFTTGNGSITNHPFVPTVKVLTTTKRYNLLSADMDINAGAYVDGACMCLCAPARARVTQLIFLRANALLCLFC
jgi:altronate dehydratase